MPHNPAFLDDVQTVASLIRQCGGQEAFREVLCVIKKLGVERAFVMLNVLCDLESEVNCDAPKQE